MTRMRLFSGILTLLLLLPATGLSAQELPDEDEAAIQSVWSELDAALLEHDLDRLMGVFAEGVIETFNEETVSIGQSAIKDRLASVLERLELKAHQSRVERVSGRRGVAVAWVSNTQTLLNREDGTETTHNIDFAAVMRKQPDGLWTIAFYQLVWPEG